MRTFITVLLPSLALALASAASVRAQEKEKANADTDFLTKVVPSTAASVKIIEYAAKYASDEKVKDFAERVAIQHKEFVKTARVDGQCSGLLGGLDRAAPRGQF
jgi:predicted outer membrane protein